MTNNLLDFVTHRLATGRAITTGDHLVEIVSKGITGVIDVWGEEDHTPLLRGTSLVWCRPPGQPDSSQPLPTSWFAESLAFALTHLARPRAKLLAHCWGGSNRGPVTTYAILRASGFGADAAERAIRSARPIAELRKCYVEDAERALKELGYT